LLNASEDFRILKFSERFIKQFFVLDTGAFDGDNLYNQEGALITKRQHLLLDFFV